MRRRDENQLYKKEFCDFCVTELCVTREDLEEEKAAGCRTERQDPGQSCEEIWNFTLEKYLDSTNRTQGFNMI